MRQKKELTTYLTRFIITLIILIIGLVFFTQSVGIKQETELSYNKFQKKVNEKQIDKVIINFSESTFLAMDKKDNVYKIDNPKYSEFKKDLLEKGIKVEEKKNGNYASVFFNVIQIGIMIAIGCAFYNLMNQQTKGPSTDVVIQEDGETVIKTKDGKRLFQRRKQHLMMLQD